MNKIEDDNILEVTVPAIGFLGLAQPTKLQINKAYLKLFVRLIVCYCTFLLFKPRLAKTWKTMFGDNEDARQREMRERIAKLEAERGNTTAGTGKKSYAVATAPTGSSPASPAAATTGTEKTGAKRRKA